MTNKNVLCGAALLFLAAVVLQILGWMENRSSGSDGLANLKHLKINGWETTNVPLGDTPEMRQIVSDVLGYDDVVSWEMTRADRLSIQVYAAYWAGGKRSAKEVGTHTPDICWINAGWKREEVGHSQFRLRDGRLLKPAESRSFNQRGAHIYVVFWHVYGDEVISYGAREPSFFDGITDLLKLGLKGRQKQYFIRIASSRPLAEFINEPAFQELLMAAVKTAPALVEWP